MKALAVARLFDGRAWHEKCCVLISHERVVGLTTGDEMPSGVAVETLATDLILAPGFVDLQVNGGGGVMFNDAPTPDTLAIMAAAHGRLGSTSILPTLISSERATRLAAIAAARQAMSEAMPGIAGLHLEGPFFALSRKGIHPAEAITPPSRQDIEDLTQDFAGPMLITLAPEMAAAADIAALSAAGRIVFAGHSDASFEQAQAGFDAGITGSTHVFNAMSQLGSRAPGLVGAAMLRGRAGVIVDLLHVHPASIAVAFACMGPDRLFLVSDAMATTGSDVASFILAGKQINLVDGKLVDAAGTLAGAHLSMAEAVKNAVEGVGLSLTDALRMATHTPAEAVGLDDCGRIAPGSRADFVALDASHRVGCVWQGGERI